MLRDKTSRITPLWLALLWLPSLLACSWLYRAPYNQQAEELLRQNKLEEAIAAYHKHIETRLALEERPDWENPYFYLLMIGDIELKMGDQHAAEAAYLEAQEHDVSQIIISDRIRYLASWYESKGQLKEAIEILQKHRKNDELLFDLMIDRLSKELVLRETQSDNNKTKDAHSPGE